MSATNLSRDSIEAGLAYCRWLHAKEFTQWLNAASPSLPKQHPPVLLNEYGKRIYDLVLKHLSAQQVRGVRTLEGERKAVVEYLCELKDGRPSDGRGRATDTGIKHATLQLNGITKFLSSGKRMIRGLANSGGLDRMGDIVEPHGGQWSLPVPLLWQHKHDMPIGWVRTIDAKSDGLWITAELAEGIGKADEAWKMIEAGLVDSYSIGFRANEWEPLPKGGMRFTSWSLLEISVVTIPADPAAKIRRHAGGSAIRVASHATKDRHESIPGHPGAVLISKRGGR